MLDLRYEKNITPLARKVLKIRRSAFWGHPVYESIELIAINYARVG